MKVKLEVRKIGKTQWCVIDALNKDFGGYDIIYGVSNRKKDAIELMNTLNARMHNSI